MAQVRAILARSDAHALDAARIGVKNLDLEFAGAGNDFAAHRKAADLRDEIAAERIDVFASFAGIERLADHGPDVIERRARVGDERAVGNLHYGRRFVIVMLVCVLASTLAIRAALRVDPAAAIGG